MSEWPPSHRRAWEEECRPGLRLRRGGAASRYAEVSRDDFARRYGAFLDFLQRDGCLDYSAAPAAQVTPANVERYIAELNGRVRSVTVWNCIYKLRMAARLLDPKADFAWLSEIEQDLALVMEPRSKFDRVVLAERLVEAGLTLVSEAETFAKHPFRRAIGIRNGLMIALLAVCPIGIKNFAALEFGRTFKEEQGNWWMTLPYGSHQDRHCRPSTGAGLSQSRSGAIRDRIKACIDRLATSDKIPLDLFADRTTVYDQEPWDADLQNHT